MILPAMLYGLVSTIVTELLKVFPKLKSSDNAKRITALTVSLVIGLVYIISKGDTTPRDYVEIPFEILLASCLLYKTVIQTIVGPVASALKK